MTPKKVIAQTYEEFIDDLIRHIRLNEDEDGLLVSSSYNDLLANLKEFVETQVKSHKLWEEKSTKKKNQPRPKSIYRHHR